MAKLTKSTGTVTLTGAVEKITLPAVYGWVWVKNMSDADMFVGLSEGISAGADGVLSIPSGDAGRIHTDGQDSVYLLGSGNALVVAQNYSDCPFKVGKKGGGADVGGESSYVLKNAVDYPLLGLNLYGKSTQDGVPTPENPVEIVSVGDSGSLSVQSCGNNLFPWNDYTTIPIYLNCITDNDVAINSNIIKMNISQTYDSGNYGVFIHKSYINRILFGQTGKVITLSCEVKSNYNVRILFGFDSYNKEFESTTNGNRISCTLIYDSSKNNSIIWYVQNTSKNTEIQISNIQIEFGDTATAYEPYHGATANITSSMPLCGIPVESGGNYTDSNGQQWICDELIYTAEGTGKIVRRTAKIDSYNGETISTPYISTTGSMTTGATVIYQLAEPQEIELTAAEMTALRELQTYNGITNISNDGGADMDITYCTNKTLSEYVAPVTAGLQKQIDELKAAVLSLGGNV